MPSLITDIIACPGLDYCALANARSIPVAQDISERFASLERQREIGELKIKISGCINACGHHHVGHIGILGVEKKGAELYQVTLGGSGDENTSIGEIIGRGFGPDEITDAIETVVDTYLAHRARPAEKFLDAYRRARPGAVQGGALCWRNQSRVTRETEALGRGREPRRALRPSAAEEIIDLSIARRVRRRRSRRVSSFGADSAVLLHMIAGVDRSAAGPLPRHRQAFRARRWTIATRWSPISA